MATNTRIRVGIGGWNYAPWRNNFYPQGLAQTKELAFASRTLTAIEVNSTYYGTQKPTTFAKWHAETPDDFVFSLKASQYATNRRVLAEAGDSVARFTGSGIDQLGAKLGPIVWQFAPTKRFEPEDFEAFLTLLPAEVGGLRLRHAMDVRHDSFMSADYLALARRFKVATVFTHSDKYPSFADATGDFIYARLMQTDPAEPQGYPPAALDRWAVCAREWRDGTEPADLPRVDPAKAAAAKARPRDVFVFFISGAKERAPAAAMGLLERLD